MRPLEEGVKRDVVYERAKCPRCGSLDSKIIEVRSPLEVWLCNFCYFSWRIETK